MATRYLVQQKWPNKWGTVAVFRSEASAVKYLEDARKAAPNKLHRVVSEAKFLSGECADAQDHHLEKLVFALPRIGARA